MKLYFKTVLLCSKLPYHKGKNEGNGYSISVSKKNSQIHKFGFILKKIELAYSENKPMTGLLDVLNK